MRRSTRRALPRRAIACLALLVALRTGLAAPAAAQAQNRFWLVNETGRVIERAFVSASRATEWGPDILGATVLPPGHRVWVTPNFGDCVLDVRVTFPDGAEATRMGVNACGVSRIVFGREGVRPAAAPPPAVPPPATAPPASAPPAERRGEEGRRLSFTFANAGSQAIRELYASAGEGEPWGADRLGARVLRPGERVPLDLVAGSGCSVDLRVVFLNGRAAERRGVDACGRAELEWR